MGFLFKVPSYRLVYMFGCDRYLKGNSPSIDRYKMRFLIALLACMQVYLTYGQQCPQTICSSDQTCCHGPVPGTYGCCPLFKAVCCSDGQHCCPETTVCNLANGSCDSISGLDAGRQEDNAGVVYCPGRTAYCQDGNTCCRTPQGEWRCCPYQFAACCPDGLHCCQQGQRCDATSRYCYRAENPFLRVASESSRPATAADGLDAKRPDGAEDNAGVVYCTSTTYCQDGNTCCRTPQGEWRCCPYQSASCCRDGLHCCQHGQVCDDTSRYCFPQGSSFLRVASELSRPATGLNTGRRDGAKDNAGVVHCPGGRSVCRDGNTCCRTQQGEWRCCPYQNAACCRDGFHCCQHGMRCDDTSRYCFPQGNPFFRVASELSRPATAAGGLDAV